MLILQLNAPKCLIWSVSVYLIFRAILICFQRGILMAVQASVQMGWLGSWEPVPNQKHFGVEIVLRNYVEIFT